MATLPSRHTHGYAADTRALLGIFVSAVLCAAAHPAVRLATRQLRGQLLFYNVMDGGRAISHTVGCAQHGVTPALGNGILLTLMQSAQGLSAALPMQFAQNFAFVYSYIVLQCPLEALHGRRSLVHNMIAGGTLGYIGVSSGRVGMFGLEMTFLANRIPLPAGGFLVYGALGGLLGALGGKSL